MVVGVGTDTTKVPRGKHPHPPMGGEAKRLPTSVAAKVWVPSEVKVADPLVALPPPKDSAPVEVMSTLPLARAALSGATPAPLRLRHTAQRAAAVESPSP